MENMITACRKRERELPWEERVGRQLENSNTGRTCFPYALTRREAFWLLLQQKQQTRRMSQPAQNGNFPWKSVSNKWVPTLEGAAWLRKNYVVLCKSLSSAPIATYQEELNFCDQYHEHAFKETASYLPPFAVSLCLCLFCWMLWSVDQSNSQCQIMWLAGSCHIQGVKMLGCQSMQLHMPTVLHLEKISYIAEPRVAGSKTFAGGLTDLLWDKSVLELFYSQVWPVDQRLWHHRGVY